MNEMTNYYKEILKREYEKRKSINPAYSLRAYSKFLGLGPTVVANVFKNQRNIPQKKVESVSQILKLSPRESYLFIQSSKITKTKLKDLASNKYSQIDETILNEERHFKIIAEWEYYAILSLMATDNFKSNPEWIARRLSLSKERAIQIINDLLKAKLIEKNENKEIKLKVTSTESTQNIPSLALRKSHLESMQIAKEKIENVKMPYRFFTSTTMAINPNKLEEAKEVIREFRKKMTAFLEDGPQKEVYRMNFQLFPLSNLENINDDADSNIDKENHI